MYTIIPNTDNVIDSSNEVLLRHTINRNFEKLLQNDISLDCYQYQQFNIRAYTEGIVYNTNDLVWFDGDDGKKYLLKCIVDNNTAKPSRENIDGEDLFINSGWQDMYQYGSMVSGLEDEEVTISSDNSFVQCVVGRFNNNLMQKHVPDVLMHKFGKLQESKDNTDKKLLLRDFSNIDENRKNNFFPNSTVFLSTDNVIRFGFYKKWDCGILEYDMVFKLGFHGDTRKINGTDYEVIVTNELELSSDKSVMSSSDCDILCQGGNTETIINGTVQTNQNSYCNSYSARLVFSVPFINTDYMIFGTQQMTQQRDVQQLCINSSADSLTYANRSQEHVDAVMLLHPFKDSSTFGLLRNSFHCKVIGRWK